MNEIVYVLESIRDPAAMAAFIKRQDINGCSVLINILRYTNDDTENRWLHTYNTLFKY